MTGQHVVYHVALEDRVAHSGCMKVLLAIDGSEISKEAVVRLPDLVRLDGVEIVLLTVAPNPVMPDMTGFMAPPYIDYNLLAQQVKAEAESTLAEAAAVLRDRGLHSKVVFVQGDPGSEILEIIRREAVDLVVVGSHGRTGFKKFLLGSVSAKIVNEAPCPVLVIKDPKLHED